MNSTKQVLLLLAVFLAASELSLSQTFSNTPNDTIVRFGQMEDFEQLIIQQRNISSDTITLKWEKVNAFVPTGWQASVCDNKICYTVLEDSGTMNPVLPNGLGLLLIDITPHINYGTAFIRYAVWDIANPAIKDTLTYIHIVNAARTTGLENKNAFELYPNPVSNKINIHTSLQTGFAFSISDITGKEIQTGVSTLNSIVLSIQHLTNGIYMFRIQSDHKFMIQKFVKQ
jgi:hypothetical protein